MKVEQSFSVQAPLAEVWAAMTDVERVARCLPGAELTKRAGEGEISGTFGLKAGPAAVTAPGSLKLETADEAARRVTMVATGASGDSLGTATITSTLSGDGGETRVELGAELDLAGGTAGMVSPAMVENVAERVIADFARCLEVSLAGTPAEALDATPEPQAAPAHSDEALADAAVASAGASTAEAAVAATPPPAAESPSDEPLAPAEPAAAEPPAPEPPAAEPPPGEPELAPEPGSDPGAEPEAPRTGSVAPPSSPRVQAAMPPPPAAAPSSGGSFMDRLRRLLGRR